MVDTQFTDDTRELGLAPVSAGQETLTGLISGIADDAQRLIHQQFQMLRAELREDIHRTKSVVLYMGIGGVGVVVGFLFVLVSAPLLLNWAFELPPWAGWAIIGAIAITIGAIGLYIGKRIFCPVQPTPGKNPSCPSGEPVVDHESPELIERQMEQTRLSLTGKVSLLEQQVLGTIQSATEAVNDSVKFARTSVHDTIADVSGAIKNSVELVSDGVKEALNVPERVRNHPWMMVGGAVAVGFVAGTLIYRRNPSVETCPADLSKPDSRPLQINAPVATSRPAWLTEMLDLAAQKVKKLAERAITLALSSIQQEVEKGIPKIIHRAYAGGRPRERSAR